MALSNVERKRNFRRRQKLRLGLDPNGDLRGKHGNQAKGAAHRRWNAERIVSSHGYIKVRVGRGHPLADPNGYAYEHLLVWMAAGNAKLKVTELLHHKNENKQDNRLENLELIERSDHAVHHNAGRERNDLGQFVGKEKAGRLLDGREWNEFPQNG